MKKYLWLHQSDSVYCFYSDFTPGKLYPHDPSQWQSRLTFDKSDVEILLNNDVIMEVETVMHEGAEWIKGPIDIPQYDDSWNCDVEVKVMLGLEIVRFVPRADFELIRIPSTGQDSISDDSNCTAPAESLPEKSFEQIEYEGNKEMRESDFRQPSSQELRYEAKRLLEIADSIVDDVNSKASKPFPSKALSLTDELPMMLGGKWGGTHD